MNRGKAWIGAGHIVCHFVHYYYWEVYFNTPLPITKQGISSVRIRSTWRLSGPKILTCYSTTHLLTYTVLSSIFKNWNVFLIIDVTPLTSIFLIGGRITSLTSKHSHVRFQSSNAVLERCKPNVFVYVFISSILIIIYTHKINFIGASLLRTHECVHKCKRSKINIFLVSALVRWTG